MWRSHAEAEGLTLLRMNMSYDELAVLRDCVCWWITSTVSSCTISTKRVVLACTPCVVHLINKRYCTVRDHKQQETYVR